VVPSSRPRLPALAVWSLLACLAGGALAGCGASQPAEAASPPPPSTDALPEAAAPKRAIPAGQIRREDILAVLSDGPPLFLQRIEVEPVRDGAGKFHGWRVMAVRDPELAASDVKLGDVVTRVNGKVIESPYQFFDVFQSMAFAPELRISIERSGQSQELRYPINDDPTSPPPPRPELSSADTGNDDGPPEASKAKATARRKKRLAITPPGRACPRPR
jgi:hypothetical protein